MSRGCPCRRDKHVKQTPYRSNDRFAKNVLQLRFGVGTSKRIYIMYILYLWPSVNINVLYFLLVIILYYYVAAHFKGALKIKRYFVTE